MATFRAAVAVALLAGFFVFAFGVVAGLVALALVVGHGVGGKLLVVAGVVAVGMARALYQVMRRQAEEPSGLLLDEADAPALFGEVRAIAAAVGTRGPDEIRLIPAVNAAVAEDTRWLGLRGGTRRMYVGVPLLTNFTVDQMRSVLAHELGHYSHSHTRLGEIAYKGRTTIIRTAQNIGARSVVGYLFRAYLWLYLLVSEAVSRRQELEADRAAVRVAGRAATASALQEVHLLDLTWRFYVDRYIAGGYENGYFPEHVFAGFAELLAARSGELADLRAAAPAGGTSRWDSHPALPDRLAAIAQVPDVPRPPDQRPAAGLVGDLAGLVRAVEADGFNVGDRLVVPWQEFTERATEATYQAMADALYRSAARLVTLPQADLWIVLHLVETGRLPNLVEAFTGAAWWTDPKQRDAGVAVFAAHLTRALEVATARSGAARFRHSWSGPVTLHTADGTPVEFAELVGAAVADPAAVAGLRAELARLGVRRASAAPSQTRATAKTAELVAAVADVRVDGTKQDLLVLDEGLVFVPRGRGGGDRRLRALLASAPVPVLAQRNWWLPYEEIAGASVRRSLPPTYEIRLYNGATVVLRVPLRSAEIGRAQDALAKVLGGMARRGAGR